MKLIRPTVFRSLVSGSVLLLMGFLFAQSGVSSPGGIETPGMEVPDRATKVNLALRRTAHHLLRSAGDSTSRIPAIQQPNPQTFRVTLARAFDYDRLPDLLQESLRLHRVGGAYDVAVLDCASGELQLGYNIRDLMGNKPVPCGGRSIADGCYIVQVTFDAPATAPQSAMHWPVLALGALLAGLLFVVWSRSTQPVAVPAQPTTTATDQIPFGQSCLDVGSQTLRSGSTQHNLTYRETKLLRLFVSRPNQILERDLILKLVWEDEGITVGRSVDVFISRLRKLLHDDPTIRIAAVHGVGYRLDVQEASVT